MKTDNSTQENSLLKQINFTNCFNDNLEVELFLFRRRQQQQTAHLLGKQVTS